MTGELSPSIPRATSSLRLTALLVVLGLLTIVSACKEQSFAQVEMVELLVDPETVTFPSVGIGEEASQAITIFNQSGATAKLDIELLEERSSLDSLREFGWEEASTPKGTIDLEGGGSLLLWVTYTPEDEYHDAGRVNIGYNGKDSPIVVPIETNQISPDIDGPSRVIIGRVPAGGTAQKRFTIQNVGFSPLTLSDLSLTNVASDVFSLCLPELEGEDAVCNPPDVNGLVLDTEETLDIDVVYTPIDDIEDTATIVVTSDDPDEHEFEIDLSANGEEPCIIVTNEEGIDFQTAAIGGVSSRTLTVTNCSPTKELVIDSIAMATGSDEEFFVDALPSPLPDEPVTLDREGTASFVINYAPTEEAANSGTLEILSNDAAKSPLNIPVNGRGSYNTCPVAVGRARVDNGPFDQQIETIPLKTIQFDASNSSDPDGAAIGGYEWTLIEQPTDSTTFFSPNASSANPQLFLDLAGTYRVELRVFDDQNMPSCEPAEIIIVATPDEDIHVQLVWDTPGDADQTDTGATKGTDLDLHFLHQAGVWNQAYYDCYWLNPTPVIGNWDPSLDIDDTDGAGPENINLNQPDSGTYRVGVYYYNAQSYGPSYATVRIYLQSSLAFEYRDKYMQDTGKFWDVAAIDWPSATVSQTDQMYNAFP